MDKHKSLIVIDYAKCSPCSGLICVDVCPQGILEVRADGKPQVIDVVSCTQCGVCANFCPAKAITVNPSKAAKDK